jgi:hypothetical protein
VDRTECEVSFNKLIDSKKLAVGNRYAVERKSMAQLKVKVGAWVRIHKTGIWQVYRILKDAKCLDPVTGAATKRTTIFAKRFVSNSFRKSLGYDCCHPSFVRPLSQQDRRKLDRFIELHSKQYAQFQEYIPDPIDCIYNARIAASTDKTPKQIAELLRTKKKFNELEIESYLRGCGLVDGFPSWTAQFRCANHEVDKNGYLQYTFSGVLRS